MTSGGSGGCRSRGRRDAIPKPVSRTSSPAAFTRILAGLMSLWMRPRRCALPRTVAMPTAMRRKRPTSIGAPRRLPSNSPPGSSSTRVVRPRSRTSSIGRTAHVLSNSSFREYSWARRSIVVGAGCSKAGCMIRTFLRPSPAPSRHPRPKTSPPSSDKILRPPIPFALNQEDGPTPKPRLRAGALDVPGRSKANIVARVRVRLYFGVSSRQP